MMQNFIMRPSAAFAKKLFIFALAATLLGCSAARLGYSNGETISYWWLNNYVNFDADQKPWVKQKIANLFAWHRKTQLKDYVQLLKRSQQRVHGVVTQAEILTDYEEIKKRLLLLTDQALPALTDLALSLKPRQIAQIEEKFASNNERYHKEYLAGDIEERQRFRYKKTMKQAEYWFGNFSREQERIIRAASDARPLDNERVLADRLRRQQELIALLKKIQAEKPSREATSAMLKKYIAATIDRFDDKEHQAFFDGSTESGAQMVTQIINIATPAQKAHFVKTLQEWIDDFNALARK